MFADTITKCSNTARRIIDLADKDKAGFWVSSAMAGAYVGLGIILIFTLGNALMGSPVKGLVMGSTFGIALTLVIIAGAELFTGHTMFLTFGVKTGAITTGEMLKVLPQTWLGNLIGSIAVAGFFALAGGGQLLGFDSSLLHKVALAKASSAPMIMFWKAVLCNWLVCLAIWMAQRTEGAAKFIAIWWCLLAFIASGFEHSVANMTVFALSWFGQHSSELTMAGIGNNLLWVTLGNTFSGVVLMGLGYWYSTPAKQRPMVESVEEMKLAKT